MTDFIERRSGWPEYQNLVLNELKQLHLGQDALNVKFDTLKDSNAKSLVEAMKGFNDDLTTIKVKIATMMGWALGCGAAAGLAVELLSHFIGRG